MYWLPLELGRLLAGPAKTHLDNLAPKAVATVLLPA